VKKNGGFSNWWTFILGLSLIAGGGCYIGILIFTVIFGAALAIQDIAIVIAWFALFVVFICKSYDEFFGKYDI
jgi:hypothetical protein